MEARRASAASERFGLRLSRLVLPRHIGGRAGCPPIRCEQFRLLASRTPDAGVGDRARVRQREPWSHRDSGYVGEWRAIRRRHGPLLLDRCRAGDGVPRHRHDAVLLPLEGAVGPRILAAALQQPVAHLDCGHLRGCRGVDCRRQPLCIGDCRERPAGLEYLVGHHRRGRVRARLRRRRRAGERHLWRGAAILHHCCCAGAAQHRRRALRRRLRPSRPPRHSVGTGRQRIARVERHRSPHIEAEPNRLELHWHRAGARVRAVLRLLDHQFRRGAAGAFGQGSLGRSADSVDCRVPEAADPGGDDHSRAGRADVDRRISARASCRTTTRFPL